MSSKRFARPTAYASAPNVSNFAYEYDEGDEFVNILLASGSSATPHHHPSISSSSQSLDNFKINFENPESYVEVPLHGADDDSHFPYNSLIPSNWFKSFPSLLRFIKNYLSTSSSSSSADALSSSSSLRRFANTSFFFSHRNKKRNSQTHTTEFNLFYFGLLGFISCCFFFFWLFFVARFPHGIENQLFDAKLHPKKKCVLAMLSTYPPRACGIGTFAKSLADHLEQTGCEVHIFALERITKQWLFTKKTEYPRDRVKFVVREKDRRDLEQVARYMNHGYYDALIIQHEYGLYLENSDLGDVIAQMKRVPVYVIVHNANFLPTPFQYQSMTHIARHATRIVLMSERSVQGFIVAYGVPREKLHMIHHGVLDVAKIVTTTAASAALTDDELLGSIQVKAAQYKRDIKTLLEKDVKKVSKTNPVIEVTPDTKIILTFGLLHRQKGVHLVINALPTIVKDHPNTLYVCLGQMNMDEKHQNLQQQLMKLAKELNVDKHVLFINKFTPDDELIKFLLVTDVYVTPYMEYTPISGTVSYAMALARTVVSTEFKYAQELVKDDFGQLVAMGNFVHIGSAISFLLSNPQVALASATKAFHFTRKHMLWSQVAQQYICLIGSTTKTSVNALNQPTKSDVIDQEVSGHIGRVRSFVEESNIQCPTTFIPNSTYCTNFTDHQVKRRCATSYAHIRACDNRQMEMDVAIPSQEERVYNLLSDPFLQLNGRLKSSKFPVHGTKENLISQVGLRWNPQNRLFIDSETKTIKLLNGSQPLRQLQQQGYSISISYLPDQQTKVLRFIKRFHYTIEFALQSISPPAASYQQSNSKKELDTTSELFSSSQVLEDDQDLSSSSAVHEISWIDIHITPMNEFLAPYGIIGQTNRFIHDTEKEWCHASLASPYYKDATTGADCHVIFGSEPRYVLKDGLFGHQSSYNFFEPQTSPIDMKLFCEASSRKKKVADADSVSSDRVAATTRQQQSFTLTARGSTAEGEEEEELMHKNELRKTKIHWIDNARVLDHQLNEMMFQMKKSLTKSTLLSSGKRKSKIPASAVDFVLTRNIRPFLAAADDQHSTQHTLSPYVFTAEQQELRNKNRQKLTRSGVTASTWIYMYQHLCELGSIQRDLAVAISNAFDQIWVPSQFVYDCLLRTNVIFHDKLSVVPIGLPNHAYQMSKSSLSFDTNVQFLKWISSSKHLKSKYKFLFYGELCPEKGIDIVLDAFYHLKQDPAMRHQVQLVIIRVNNEYYDKDSTNQEFLSQVLTKIEEIKALDEQQQQQQQQEADADKTDSSSSSSSAAAGEVPEDEDDSDDPFKMHDIIMVEETFLEDVTVNDMFEFFDAVVSPYRTDHLGYSILEAMAKGVPVLMTNYGSPLDFATVHNAYLLRHSTAPCRNEIVQAYWDNLLYSSAQEARDAGAAAAPGADEAEEEGDDGSSNSDAMTLQPATLQQQQQQAAQMHHQQSSSQAFTCSEVSASELEKSMRYVMSHREEAKLKGLIARRMALFHRNLDRTSSEVHFQLVKNKHKSK